MRRLRPPLYGDDVPAAERVGVAAAAPRGRDVVVYAFGAQTDYARGPANVTLATPIDETLRPSLISLLAPATAPRTLRWLGRARETETR